MKVWVDAQLPPSLCGWLARHSKLEAFHADHTGLREAEDAEVFGAMRRPGVCVMTKDEDFVDLVTRLAPPPQILHLQVGNCGNEELQMFLLRGLPAAMEALARGDPAVLLRRLVA